MPDYIDSFTVDPGEAKRNQFQVYYLTDPETYANPFWLGRGNEDMGLGMNPQTNEADDVQGNYIYDIQAYRKAMSVDPLNVNGSDPYSVAVLKISLGEKTYSDARLPFLVVCVPLKDSAGKSYAFFQYGVIASDTLAPGIGSINVTHTVNFVDTKIEGTFDIATKTFTPKTVAAG